MQANIRNDELLVKLTAVVQRVIQSETKLECGELGLSDTENAEILDKIQSATENIQKEVEDISLGISEGQ